MKKIIGAQGEITIVQIDKLPDDMETKPVDASDGGCIISHSESGAHHVLTGGNVMERTDNVPEGMRMLYAVLENPEKLVQDAPTPHESYDLPPGIYEFRIAREFDPFAEQARQVAD